VAPDPDLIPCGGYGDYEITGLVYDGAAYLNGIRVTAYLWKADTETYENCGSYTTVNDHFLNPSYPDGYFWLDGMNQGQYVLMFEDMGDPLTSRPKSTYRQEFTGHNIYLGNAPRFLVPGSTQQNTELIMGLIVSGMTT